MNLNKLLCLCVLCLLICLDTCPHVFLCIFSSLNCLNFPHSPTAFISIELPKQLHPSTKNPGTAGHPHKYTHCVILTHTYTHFFFCSASLQSSCIYPRWNWVEQWHDGKGVVWWAWWKVESSPRWPLSGGGGESWGLWRCNGLVSLWPEMLSRVMISCRCWEVKTAQLQFILGGFFGGWHRHFAVVLTAISWHLGPLNVHWIRSNIHEKIHIFLPSFQKLKQVF